jgi:hypothetical protein
MQERVRAGSNFDQHLGAQAARDAESARTQEILDEMAVAREVDDAFAERMALEEMPTYPMRERGIPETGWRAPQQIGQEIAGNQESARAVLREQMRTGDFRNLDAPQREVPELSQRVTPDPESLTDFLAMHERASGQPARVPLDPEYAQQLERIGTMHGARQSGIGDYLDADTEIVRQVQAREAAEPFEDIAGRMRAERAARFEEPRYPPPPPRKPWEVEARTPEDAAMRALVPERYQRPRAERRLDSPDQELVSGAPLEQIQSELAPGRPNGSTLLRQLLDSTTEPRTMESITMERLLHDMDRFRDWRRFERPKRTRAEREAVNAATLEKHESQFGKKPTAALQEFAQRYPRIFSALEIEPHPNTSLLSRTVGDFEALDTTELASNKAGLVRLHKDPKFTQSADSVYSTVVHEARHGLDRARMGGRDYQQMLVDQYNVPYDARMMERTAVEAEMRATARRQKERELGRPLTAAERLELDRPRRVAADIAKVEDEIGALGDRARVARASGDTAEVQRIAAERAPLMSRLARLRSDISGEASAEIASGLAGGTGGALYGATQGEDADDRIRNALLMGAAGAAGGAGLARMLGGRAAGDVAQAMPRTIPERKYPTATGGKLGEHMASARVLEFDPNAGPKPPVEAMPRAQRENLGLEKFHPEQRDTIQSLIDEYGYGPLESQRRGRQSTERTNWLAQAMAVPAGRKLAPGANLNAEGHVAYGNAVASVQDQLREVGQRIKETGGTEADLLKQAELLEAHKVLFFSYAGLRTEAGRALNVYKAMKEALPSELRLVREMLDRGRLRGDMADLADVLANLPKDPRAAMKALRAAQTRSKMEAFGSYFTANILSGIATQERNFLGNAARMLTRVAEKAAISRIDPLRAMLAGHAQGTGAAKFLGSPERQVFTGEAMQEVRGIVSSLDRAFWDAASTMRHGFSIDATMSGLQNVTPLTIPRKEFGGGGANPINYPGRILEGVDRFFRNLNYGAELYALTHAQARRELGSKAPDVALAQRVAELRANPSRDLQRRAAKSAEAAVFQEEGGPALKMLESIKNHIPALQILLPFLRTPHNIVMQGLKRTPGGAAMPGMRSEDARDQAMHFGEAAIGTAVSIPLLWAASKGQITGSGPTDPQKRQAIMERGWRPNSVNVNFLSDDVAQALGATKSDDGTYWVNYQLLQPYAIPMSIVANAVEAWEEEGKKGGAMDAAVQTAMRVGRSTLDQSFLSGLSDFFDALNDPGRGAEQFFGRIASGVIPMSGLLRSAARYMDPTVRQPETWGEHIQAGIPGMSDELAPKLTRFGEDVQRQGSPFIVPEVSGVNLDPISEELTRVGLDIGSPSDRLETTRLMRMLGIEGELEPKDMLELQRLRGRTARASIAAVMGAPGYENLPDEVRAELLSRTLRKGSTKVNKVARAALISQQPDLIRLLGDPMAEAAAKTYGK